MVAIGQETFEEKVAQSAQINHDQPMKIVSIDQKRSTENCVAFRTDTPITGEIEKHFRNLYSQQKDISAIEVNVQGSMVLVYAVSLPKGYADAISNLLTQAEGMVAHQKEIERQNKTIQDSAKNDFLGKIANSQNLPIR